MAEVKWTPEAELWLQEIHAFIAADNPAAAKKVVDGIYKKADLLTQFPEYGFRFEAESGIEIRILLYGRYRIAYRIVSSTRIDILGVFHAALDINEHL